MLRSSQCEMAPPLPWEVNVELILSFSLTVAFPWSLGDVKETITIFPWSLGDVKETITILAPVQSGRDHCNILHKLGVAGWCSLLERNAPGVYEIVSSYCHHKSHHVQASPREFSSTSYPMYNVWTVLEMPGRTPMVKNAFLWWRECMNFLVTTNKIVYGGIHFPM